MWKKKSNRGNGAAHCPSCGYRMRVAVLAFKRSGRITCPACGNYMEPAPKTARRILEESDSVAISREIIRVKTEDQRDR